MNSMLVIRRSTVRVWVGGSSGATLLQFASASAATEQHMRLV